MLPIKPATLAIRVQCEGMPTEDALARIEAVMRIHTDAVDLRFARAVLLEELGRLTLARGAYKDVLARDPAHFGALMNLGTMVFLEGHRPEARLLYQQAIKAQPHAASAFINLANVLAADDPVAARDAYLRALQLDPANATGNFGLALLLEAHDDVESARAYRRRAFAEPIVRAGAYRGTGEPLRLLVLLAANGGNILTTQIIDDGTTQATTFVADSFHAERALPAHDVIFNAIGDADRAADALAMAERIAAASRAPFINPPDAVRNTQRAAVERLGNVPGVTAPRTLLLPREAVTADDLTALGFAFPLLLRTPGQHLGEHFAYVKTVSDLPVQLAALPGPEILAIAFLDARGRDGKPRTYRALMLDGTLYPVHLAIAETWKTHYFASGMRDNAAHQAEERAYLDDMASALGPRVMEALAGIATLLALDYCGIDFGIDAGGGVLVFEANPTLGVYLPDGDPRFAYRRPAIARIGAAANAMFMSRARSFSL